MLRKISANQLVRYLFTGGLAYGIELSVLLSLYALAGLTSTTATAISFWVGLVISFVLQRMVAFQDYRKELKVISKQLSGYVSLVLFNYIFTLTVVNLAPDKHLLISRTAALLITMCWNFFIYKTLFTKKNKSLPSIIEAKLDRTGLFIVTQCKRVVKLAEKPLSKKIFVIFCWLTLLAATSYAAVQASRVQATTADQFITTFIFRDISEGTSMISSDHTNILKFPILWLQGNLPYNNLSFYILNVAFTFTAFGAWSMLIGRLFGKRAMALSLLVFSAVISNSTAFAINTTMTTIRHIEYPLALWLLYLVSQLLYTKKSNHLYTTSAISLLTAAIILNDKLFMYTLIPAALLGISACYWKEKRIKPAVYTIAGLATGSLLGVMLPKIISATGWFSIVSGYAKIGSFAPFEQLPDAAWLTLQQTLDLFGGNIFGTELNKVNASLFIGLLLFTISSLGAARLLKQYVATNNRQDKSYFVIFCLILFGALTLFSYASTDLAKPYNARYLTGIVFVGVALFCITAVRTLKGSTLLFISLSGLLVIGTVLALPRTHNSYSQSIAIAQKGVDESKKITGVLEKENVQVLVAPGGNFYLKYYSADTGLTMVQLKDHCDTPSEWANNSSWLHSAAHKKSAFFVDTARPEAIANTCTTDSLEKIYGKPQKIIPVKLREQTNATKYLYIYNYDIRSRLNLTNIAH